MQTTMLRSSPVQSRTCSRTSSFTPSKACPKARKSTVVVAAQADQKAWAPKAAGALLAAVAAVQFGLTDAAQAGAVEAGQTPSSKYFDQAKQFAGDAAANKLKDAPEVKTAGGSNGVAEFAPSMQAQGARGKDAPKDIRGGTPKKVAGWMNVMPDMSAAPVASKDAAAANDGQANLPKAGAFSKVATDVGKSLTGALPDAPDISNPKAAKGKPTAGKLTKPSNPLKDIADADLGDNKPNFPTPDVNTSQGQDIFKQLGDKLRGIEPSSVPSPGKVGESIAANVNGPDPKQEVSKVSKNLPNIAQNTDIAPESIGAKANVRN